MVLFSLVAWQIKRQSVPIVIGRMGLYVKYAEPTNGWQIRHVIWYSDSNLLIRLRIA